MLTADRVEPDAADAGDWRMRSASDVTADIYILSRQSMPPVVTAVQCQCQVTLAVAAWLSQGWG